MTSPSPVVRAILGWAEIHRTSLALTKDALYNRDIQLAQEVVDAMLKTLDQMVEKLKAI
jgi:hypothetical protein